MHNIRDIYIKIKNTTYNAQTVIAKIFLPMKHVVQWTYIYIYICSCNWKRHTSKYFTEKMDVFYIEYLIYIYKKL